MMIVWLVLFGIINQAILLEATLTYTENNINTPIVKSFCGPHTPIILSNFIKNRNSTFARIRRQLLSNNLYFARGESLDEADSVFGIAQCRNYLSTAQCVACFDAAVFELLINCTTANAAYVFFDNCSLRYNNKDNFYTNPFVIEDVVIGVLTTCGNQSTSQSTTHFSQTAERLLSDITEATPKTSNFYVASKRQITSGNATVYSIAQCLEKTSQDFCQSCMTTAYKYVYRCLPNTEGRFIGLGCFVRYSETPFFNDNQTIDITSFLKAHSSKASIVNGAIAGTIGLLFSTVVLWSLFRLIMKKYAKNSEEGGCTIIVCAKDSQEFKRSTNYNYKDLQLATNNFSKENILGRGGFGEVFKAILDDNDIVAVKKIEVAYAKVKEEFENEVKLVCNVRHRNILRLLGWSIKGSSLLLVLEYMPNGSLDSFLWGAKRGILKWKQRYEIILGIAKGLIHLHNEFHVKIIHRDIKSSNILLDDDFQPKIADFGLARFQPEDQSHISTKFGGTLGYTPPEYALYGILSNKVDTYSFGIVILEIISGRKCNDMNSDRPSMDYLLEHAWKLYESKQHLKLVDETLDANQSHQEHVMQIIEIALMCTQSPVSKRPTMSEVLSMLLIGQSSGRRQLTRPPHINPDHDRRVHIG